MQPKNILILALLTTIAAGCGGGDPQQQAVSKQAASEECIGCHADALSPGTGNSIPAEWRVSRHNIGNGAACADCHEPAAGHPNQCSGCHGGAGSASGYEVSRNPDAEGRCDKCHGPTALARFPDDVMLRLAPQHFGNMTASAANTGYRASYVSSRYLGNCRKCHNPHDPSSAIAISRDWARSPHAQTTALAYTYSRDLKTYGSPQPAATSFGSSCVRCHTTTGYLNFVNSGFSDQHAWGDPSDKTKQVTGCDACHDGYSFRVRPVAAVTIYYNYSSGKSFPTVKLNNKPTRYPDAGASNVCLPCHTGRGIGQQIKDAAAAGLDFANANSPGAHYRAVGANLFQKSGYEFEGRGYLNPAFLHSSIGIGNSRATGSKGPCVSCHMASGASHLFLPVTLDAAKAVTGIVSATCVNCHDGAFKPSLSAAGLQGAKSGFAAALALLNQIKAGKSTSTNWDSFSPGNGANTMGASFNYSLLSADPGAFAHNPLYTKRLIYDSIDWISDASLDGDVEAAVDAAQLPATVANPVTKIAYTPAEIAGLKRLAVSYLLGSGGGRP